MVQGAARYFGIDLGTSSCSVAYVVDDPRLRSQQLLSVLPVTFDRGGETSNRLPSVISVDLDERRDERRKKLPGVVRGWAFFQQLFDRKPPSPLLKRGRDYVSSAKSDLGGFKVYPHSKIPGVRTPVQATEKLIEEVIRATRSARAELDPTKSKVVVTVPASFSAIARAQTLEAIHGAGFRSEHVELLDEPIAALIDLLNSPDGAAFLDETPRNVLIFDYGAGTCDLALVRVRFDSSTSTGLSVQNLAISPYLRLGGDDVDRAVLDHVLVQAFGTTEALDELPAEQCRGLADTLLPAVARPLKEKLCRMIEDKIASTGEDGWDRLAEEPVAVTHSLDRAFGPLKARTRFELSSAEFENLMEPLLSVGPSRQPTLFGDDDGDEPAKETAGSLLQPILETLARGRVAPRDLHLLVFHGGGSLNPFVRRLLVDRLRDVAPGFDQLNVTRTPDMLTSVARGAAIACYWRHARGHEMVRPILGETLAIMTSDQDHYSIVEGGTPLPCPDDPDALADIACGPEKLFAPSTPVSQMLVPFTVGQHGEERLAGSILVPLAAGTRPRAPVRIKFRIGRNKTLQWYFSVAGGPFVEAKEVEDPWTRNSLTVAERELLEHRRTMFERASGALAIPDAMLIEEANLLRLAGQEAAGLEVIDDYLAERSADDAVAHNVRGLCLSSMGRWEEASQAYRRASALRPETAVYWGNTGFALCILGREDEAIAALRTAVTLAPTLGYCYERLGVVYRRRGDEASAIREYSQALRLAEEAVSERPFSGDAWRAVARCRHALGMYDEAAEAERMAMRQAEEARLGGSILQCIEGPGEP